ncbi:acylneuraminate cytidylyltransferase [Bdellovibrio sp. BCCA]|uniref:acylneuraminate cytidylyltransferase n=2 Tax=unclassified Bdellovibrio TaxID=2633795 RepID=UPI0030F0DB42
MKTKNALSINLLNEGTTTMKAIVIAALLALSFTTGFTCSKNQPAEQAPATTETAPATTTEAAPAEGTPAATTEAAPATTEAAPAAPAGETK